MTTDQELVDELRAAYDSCAFPARPPADLMRSVRRARRRHHGLIAAGTIGATAALAAGAVIGVGQLSDGGPRSGQDRVTGGFANNGAPATATVGGYQLTADDFVAVPLLRQDYHPAWPGLSPAQQQQITQDAVHLQAFQPAAEGTIPRSDDPAASDIVVHVLRGSPDLLTQIHEGAEPVERSETVTVNGHDALLEVRSEQDHVYALTWSPAPDTRIHVASSAIPLDALLTIAESMRPAAG